LLIASTAYEHILLPCLIELHTCSAIASLTIGRGAIMKSTSLIGLVALLAILASPATALTGAQVSAVIISHGLITIANALFKTQNILASKLLQRMASCYMAQQLCLSWEVPMASHPAGAKLRATPLQLTSAAAAAATGTRPTAPLPPAR
jgi:hypothetical protein